MHILILAAISENLGTCIYAYLLCVYLFTQGLTSLRARVQASLAEHNVRYDSHLITVSSREAHMLHALLSLPPQQGCNNNILE
jgi:hypothetical protein